MGNYLRSDIPIKKPACLADDTGSFLIPLSMSIVVLIGISFYTIDMALMFKARYDLQVATDAAVTRALQMISSNPNLASSEQSQLDIIHMSQLTAIDNLKNSISQINYTSWDPVDSPPVLVDIEFEPELRVFASGAIDVKTWLVDKLPIGMDSATVDSFAEGRKKKIAVALVMDLSGSMEDEVDDEAEQCEDSDDDCEDISKRKFEYLKEAAQEFISNFGAYLDGIVIITFNSQASDVYSKDTAMSSSEIQTLMHSLSQISPNSAPSGYGVGGRTNMAHALRKARVKLNNMLDEPGWEDAYPVIIMISDGAPNECISDFLCACDGAPGSQCSRNNPNCSVLNTYGTYAPYMSFVVNLADEIREEDGINIFSVGIGTPAGETENPFQEGTGDALKSYFMRRLSNDPIGLDDPQFMDGSGSDGHCVQEDLGVTTERDTQGIYVQSFGSNLSPILNSFGEKILTRISD